MPDAQIYLQDYIRPEKIRPVSTRKHHEKHEQKLGNPTPLGLSAFGLSTFIAAFHNLQAFGIIQQNMLVGVSLFTGGVVQFAAGMWEFKVGNTFGGTGFSAFGGFWASFGVIYIPNFIGTWQDDNQFHHALGVFCLAWLIFTFIFTLACMRTNAGVLSAFIFLTLTFASETIYHFYPDHIVFLKASGVFCLITSMLVWYCFAATILTPDLSPIALPVWSLARPS
jgi:hypothetical protein